MRPAALISFVLLCLLGASADSAPLNRGAANPPAAASRAVPEDDDDGPPIARNAAAAPPQPGIRAERRRRSYASCNRDSHKRGLRGGARRRFLIRCKLGYERRQPPTATQGKRP